MEKRMKIGPKGQLVIPKDFRDKLGIKEFTEVLVDLRGDQVVITKSSPRSVSYSDFFTSTYARKLARKVDIKKIMEEEYERDLLH
ncbi:MAG: AbrB/MazE/SpoVT family DNA-binding domain-containing protein [Candidatus Thermoplasmatota archaeon]|jgi:AbrB family looped-hinge helix DNA binding protein|nr:AbrB/MazE/SpoVT family DNA-binding domain-containing protein [Candidatus Sysuiplasma jiujiangense]MCL5252668.1 AbrB/MazE/SpoVT family DNA-binding domain-containing protein [Candidatus Thermoplasmatota archaeon]